MVGELREMMRRLIAQGDMRAPEPIEDLDRLANNGFLVWTSWLRFLGISRPNLQLRPEDVVEGALHNFLTFAPYVKPAFAEQVRTVLARRANTHNSPPPASIGSQIFVASGRRQFGSAYGATPPVTRKLSP